MLGSLFFGPMVLGQVPQLAPLNPEFVRVHEAASKLAVVNYGLRPIPVDLSYLRGQAILPPLRPRVALAAKYDLRALGKVTPVRNQGPHGTCWAHATFGSMESCLLPAESRDFAENHLVNLDGFDYVYDIGGHYFMSMAYLAGWSGPVNETDDPYPNPDASPTGLTAVKHAQQMRIIPGKSGPEDNDLIKQAVVDGGAVYASYYHEDGYFNPAENAYRYPESNPGNHAVTLVGWDDNFDKAKFTIPAPGNGAYIVKNSWGESWGEGGYYYVSYYDSRFGYETMCAFHGVEAADNYAEIYSYDPLGWVANLGIGTPTFWGSNLFTATATGKLGAVGFYANSLNTSYTIRVYGGVAAGAPGSGTLVTTKTGTSAFPGYYTIHLDTPVEVTSGQRFSIVIGMTTPGYSYPFPIEYVLYGYSSAAAAAAGQSFYSTDGNDWYDLASWNTTANFCIKGYTVINGSPEIAIEQPAGTGLNDAVGTVECGAAAIGSSSATKAFTIKNTGAANLTGIAVSADGSDAADWVVNTAGMSATLAPGGSTSFSATFKPLGTLSGNRNAALHIASSDADENPFDIALTGQAYSSTADSDGDGLNDWAEHQYASLGFDWQLKQPSLVADLYGNANFAGLYTASQVQALNVGTPLIARDPESGHFTLTIGLKKSTDLMDWSEFPFTASGTTINDLGRIEFDFGVPDNAAFFRLESR